MKSLRIIFQVITLLTIIFFVGGLLLPSNYNVSRSMVIKASDSVVYKNVIDFNNFVKWDPWSRMEPTASVEILGEAGTPGHSYKWSGKDLGKGYMKLLEAKQYSAVDFELNFEEPMESKSQSHFSLEKIGDDTKVTWMMQGETDSTLDKWIYLNMDNMIGGDFDDGLNNLKQLSENH